MIISLKTAPRSDCFDVEVEKGIKLEDLAEKYRAEVPFRILAAKVNNKIEDLNMVLNEPCSVELLDRRTQSTNMIYQHSLVLLYLKAVRDVLGKVQVNIKNPLNKGIFTTIELPEEISAGQVDLIEKAMKEMVEADIPFIRKSYPREEGLKMLMEDGQHEKARLLMRDTGREWVKFYSLGDLRDFFYGLMVPSTGYIEYFELRKYKNGVLVRFPHPAAPNIIPE